MFAIVLDCEERKMIRRRGIKAKVDFNDESLSASESQYGHSKATLYLYSCTLRDISDMMMTW